MSDAQILEDICKARAAVCSASAIDNQRERLAVTSELGLLAVELSLHGLKGFGELLRNEYRVKEVHVVACVPARTPAVVVAIPHIDGV